VEEDQQGSTRARALRSTVEQVSLKKSRASAEYTRSDASPVVGDRGYRLFAQDWRTRSAMAWVAEKHEALQEGVAAVTPAVTPPQERSDHVVLSRPEFDTAVRDALRALWWPGELAANPLNRSRLVAEQDQNLHDVLLHAIETLLGERGGETRHRVLTSTYSKTAPTQEAAARRLGMSFSTYRRHLTAAVQHIRDVLWSHELSGTAVLPPGRDLPAEQ
jgi:hypothetical protein